MKYIDDLISWKTKKYQNITEIRNNCEDILIEFSDRGYVYVVYGTEGGTDGTNSKDSIRIDIGEDNGNLIKLKEFKDEFDHLLSYLKEERFILIEQTHNSKGSYYLNDHDWEYYESCPECGSLYVNSSDEDPDFYICNKCEFKGFDVEFLKSEYPLDMGDLTYSIDNNYYINLMCLYFTR